MTGDHQRPTTWVEDRLAVQDAISAVSFHTDLREYNAVFAYYTDDAIMDYTALFGPDGKLPVRVQRERAMEFLPGLDATHHQTTNFQIQVHGDEATSKAQVRATHILGDQVQIVGGTYHHHLRRTAEGWKIYYHRLDVVFSYGPDLFEPARARVLAGKAGQSSG